MARLHLVKTLVNQRLTAAAEEIFGVFERTITQYEEEIHRQREMLDLVFNHCPEIKLKLLRADPAQLSVCEEEEEEEEVPPERQGRSPRQEEEPEALRIKEEQEEQQEEEQEEELWTSPERERLQYLEEADLARMTSEPVYVKSERPDDRPQSSWFHQAHQTEPHASTSTERMKTDPAAREDHRGPSSSEPARNLTGDLEANRYVQTLSSDCSGTETNDSDEWEEPGEPRAGLDAPKSHRVKGRQRLSAGNKFKTSLVDVSHGLKAANQILNALCCKVCGATFNKRYFMCHVKVHLNGCGLCGKRLEPTESLERHLQDHRTCKICGKIFNRMFEFVRHSIIHTGEKPFSCTVCNRRFSQRGNLKVHMKIHTGERP